jgi:hypothetical protein
MIDLFDVNEKVAIVKFKQGNDTIQTELTSEQLEFLQWLIENDCVDIDGLEIEKKE